jgi:hypothetical protein
MKQPELNSPRSFARHGVAHREPLSHRFLNVDDNRSMRRAAESRDRKRRRIIAREAAKLNKLADDTELELLGDMVG